MSELSPQPHRHVGQLKYVPSPALQNELLEPMFNPEALRRRKGLSHRTCLELGSAGIFSYDDLSHAAAGQSIKSTIPATWSNYHLGLNEVSLEEVESNGDIQTLKLAFHLRHSQALELARVTAPNTVEGMDIEKFLAHPISRRPDVSMTIKTTELGDDFDIAEERIRVKRINAKLGQASAKAQYYIHHPEVIVHRMPLR